MSTWELTLLATDRQKESYELLISKQGCKEVHSFSPSNYEQALKKLRHLRSRDKIVLQISAMELGDTPVAIYKEERPNEFYLTNYRNTEDVPLKAGDRIKVRTYTETIYVAKEVP